MGETLSSGGLSIMGVGASWKVDFEGTIDERFPT